MNNKFFTLLFLCGMLLLSSCYRGLKGNGDVITEKRRAGEFDRIKASRAVDVIIRQGRQEEITVKADENLTEHIITEIRDGQLEIYLDENIYKASAKQVYVTVKELNSLDVSSAADLKSEGLIYADEFHVEASSGADVELEIEAKNLHCEASSGADVDLSGWAGFLEAKASSGSDVDAEDLEAENATVKASSGSDVSVYAKEELSVEASSGSDVSYKGNPRMNNIRSSSGSDVRKM
jgi:hypothetical protein